MEFKKGDRVVHLGLKLVGTFIEMCKYYHILYYIYGNN